MVADHCCMLVVMKWVDAVGRDGFASACYGRTPFLAASNCRSSIDFVAAQIFALLAGFPWLDLMRMQRCHEDDGFAGFLLLPVGSGGDALPTAAVFSVLPDLEKRTAEDSEEEEMSLPASMIAADDEEDAPAIAFVISRSTVAGVGSRRQPCLPWEEDD
ncbi:hypothetical protein ACLOJK_001933 [Asimina triloba]